MEGISCQHYYAGVLRGEGGTPLYSATSGGWLDVSPLTPYPRLRRDTLKIWLSPTTPQKGNTVQACAPGYFSILCKCYCPAVPSGSPFSIYKFGNAELSPAGGVGTLNRRVAGDVIAHVLHQLFQLGACRKERAVRLGSLTPGEPGDQAQCEFPGGLSTATLAYATESFVAFTQEAS